LAKINLLARIDEVEVISAIASGIIHPLRYAFKDSRKVKILRMGSTRFILITKLKAQSRLRTSSRANQLKLVFLFSWRSSGKQIASGVKIRFRSTIRAKKLSQTCAVYECVLNWYQLNLKYETSPSSSAES